MWKMLMSMDTRNTKNDFALLYTTTTRAMITLRFPTSFPISLRKTAAITVRYIHTFPSKGGDTMRILFTTVALSALAFVPISASFAHVSNVSQAINSFVETLYPKGSHYFWVINDTTKESKQELIVDINTTLQGVPNEEAKQRFLLLLVNGELVATQKIPLGAKTDCKQEEQV